MTDLAEASEVADCVHDVVGGFALRLVDDQSAIEGGWLGFAWHGGERSANNKRPAVLGRQRPAAWLGVKS